MNYFALSPEVAGEIGEKSRVDFSVHPPVVESLQYVFHGWLGDALLESFPVYIVTKRLAEAIASQPITGYRFREVEVETSKQFQELYPERTLPSFLWLVPFGEAGSDDFGTSDSDELVVSESVMELFKQFQLTNCDIEEFP